MLHARIPSFRFHANNSVVHDQKHKVKMVSVALKCLRTTALSHFWSSI